MKEQSHYLKKLSVIKENVQISDSEKLAALEKLLSEVELRIGTKEVQKQGSAQDSRLERVLSGVVSPTAYTMAGLYMCNMMGLFNSGVGAVESGVYMTLGLGLGLVWSLPFCRPEETKEYYKLKKEIKELKGDRAKILKAVESLKSLAHKAGAELASQTEESEAGKGE